MYDNRYDFVFIKKRFFFLIQNDLIFNPLKEYPRIFGHPVDLRDIIFYLLYDWQFNLTI